MLQVPLPVELNLVCTRMQAPISIKRECSTGSAPVRLTYQTDMTKTILLFFDTTQCFEIFILAISFVLRILKIQVSEKGIYKTHYFEVRNISKPCFVLCMLDLVRYIFYMGSSF